MVKDNLQTKLQINNREYLIYDLGKAAENAGFNLRHLPYCLRVLFENSVRHNNVQAQASFKNWLKERKSTDEVAFMPARVLMQDFTGVPAIVDLAAMRDALKSLGGNPLDINPLIPVDLVIDHSVQVDFAGSRDAFEQNVDLEMKRNKERYEFLRWGQQAFSNFRVVPPGTGICHQVNLEYLAQVVWTKEQNGQIIAYPDTLVGTDSHTTMVNGLSVLGWGVGGIEAEAAMLGQSLPMILPEVVGFKLVGKMQEGITATDLVLTVTQMLRKKGVVGKFVEFYGEGLDNLNLADRATIANMAPEYGATCGFFPIDQETIKYLNLTARSKQQAALVEKYARHQHLWRSMEEEIEYTDILTLDLSTLEPVIAGPKRPQDKVTLTSAAANFATELSNLAKGDKDISKKYPVISKEFQLSHGDVVIAAITSCTNTSNPSVMIAAGLVAKKAIEQGLAKKPWVKASLAPGSKVVTEYLKKAGLDKYLDMLGFDLVGYGCTTCIGNSGPLSKEIEDVINTNQLVVASVLSGNRNFEGRVHPLVRANYLASPPLVVAYALAGTMNLDIATKSFGINTEGKPVYLKDIWPSKQEIEECIAKSLQSEMFAEKYEEVFLGDKAWTNLKTSTGSTYNWDRNSTYINNPPYFVNIKPKAGNFQDIKSAKILAIFGDSITTDHISPAGNIAKNSPAAKYLINNNVLPADFNSYGSRRGNHEVMMRGTFANIRIKNEMCPGTEGGVTIYQPSKEQVSIYDAAIKYKEDNTPLVIFAGKEYGTGSSRDWAAKGTSLLGVKAVIAESFERIHRSNLAGMGVLPLAFVGNMTRNDLKLDGTEAIDIIGLNDKVLPHKLLKCIITSKNKEQQIIDVKLEIFTENELEYIKHGSIMHKVVRGIKDESLI